jgi:CheY-like chemotaxis protein
MLRLETRALAPGQVKSTERVIGQEGDRYVSLCVTDTGEGMDSATLSRIFDPFFTTRPPDQGTGLGLSTTYGSVTQAGGHIHVFSKPGQGACFELAWPTAGEVADEIVPTRREKAGGGRNERVLLVEDQDSLRRLFQRVLRAQGYAVRGVRDAASAIRLIAEKGEDFDLLLTDVVMPGMSGLELAERVNRLLPEARVLFVSGHLEHPSLRSGTPPAGASLLRKPVSPADLCAGVRDALDGRTGAFAR